MFGSDRLIALAMQAQPWLVALAKQLNLFSLATCVAPLVVGLRYWGRLDRALQLVVGTVLVSQALLGLLSEIGRYWFHYNVVFQHLITWAETLGFGMSYWVALRRSAPRRLLVVALFGFLLMACYETVLLGGYRPYGPSNPGTHALQFGVLLLAVLLYFDQILHELLALRLEQDPLFVVGVGAVFYFAGTVLINLAADYMMFRADPGIIWTMYMVQFVLLILFNLVLAWALALAGYAKSGVNSKK